MFKIGLLGLGVMGTRHRKAAALMPELQIITREDPPYHTLPRLADPAAHQAALCAAMLADPAIDAIDLCLPTHLHAPLTIAALAAGKHVLCEKPMALTAEDCQQMLLAGAQSQRALMIAHVLRFWPAYEYLREAVAHGICGKVIAATFTRRTALPTGAPWLLQTEASGGGILDLLVHDFDQSLLLFGQPQTITAQPGGGPHAVDCALTYAAGFTVNIAGGWMQSEGPTGMGYELEGEEGALRYAEGKLRHRSASGDWVEVTLEQKDPYAAQLAYFVDCCRKEKAPALCPPQASAEAVELTLAAIQTREDDAT